MDCSPGWRAVWLLAYAPSGRRTAVQVTGLVALLALLMLVTVAKLATAQGYLL